MGLHLDTLAQLTPPALVKGFQKVQKRLNFIKKARSRYFSCSLAHKLVRVENSPLIKSYWNSTYCCGVLEQTGKELKAKYCGNRWCLTCNRIRTAKMINGYSDALKQLNRPYFLTLTIPNVRDKELRGAILGMIGTLRDIKKKLGKQGVDTIGIRKLECTYNKKRNDYHPHFHLLISGRVNTQLILDEWLKRYPKCERQAQDYRRADEKSIKELFKYFTKIVAKTYQKNGQPEDYKSIEVNSLDTIFCAMRNLRVYQPMGVVKDQAAFTKFIGKIKATNTPRKKPVQMVIQEQKDLFTEHIIAVFTATLQKDDNTPEQTTTEETEDLLHRFDKIENPKHLKRKILFNDIFKDPKNQTPQGKKLCFEIHFTGLNLPDKYQKGVRTFYKQEAIEWFTSFYKETSGISITEDMHDLFSQEVEDITEGKTVWQWDKYDWFDQQTGEVLCGYEPSEKMREICSNIFVKHKEAEVSKQISFLNNENFISEKTYFAFRSVGKYFSEYNREKKEKISEEHRKQLIEKSLLSGLINSGDMFLSGTKNNNEPLPF